MNDKKDLKKKIWLAKLKNTYANTHGNTHVYTYIVKRLEINTQKCCVYLWMGQLWKTFFSFVYISTFFTTEMYLLL